MECHCYLRNVEDLLADGKTPYEKRCGESFKGPIISLGAMVEYYPTSARDQARLHQFGKKVLPSIFPGYALIAGGIWEGNILIADIEDLENCGCIGHLSPKIECKRSLDNSEKGEFVFPVTDGTAKLSGRDYEFQGTHFKTGADREERERESLGGDSQGEAEESQPTEARDDAEARRDFLVWFKLTSFIVHHIEPRVQLYVSKEKHFPFHWNALML